MTQETRTGPAGASTEPAGAVALQEPLPSPRRAVAGSRRRGYRRRWVVVVAAAVLAAGGVTLGLVFTGSSGASYVPVTVGFGNVSQSVTASGTLQPVTSANVNFQVTGTVNSVKVSDGEGVTAGQTLATVGTQSLELNLQEAEANLAGAQASLSGDESSDASSSTIESDDAQVASDESALTQARDDLADATLTAPISGTITTLELAVGGAVAGSAGSGSGGGGGGGSDSGSGSTSNEVVIENLSSFEVSASVNAGSAGSVKVGEQAQITPSSSGSAPVVFGTVTSVSTVPTVTSGVASFPVIVTVTGSPSGLYSGTSANVSIITAQRDNVLVVPSAAVLDYPSGQYVEKLVHGHQVLTRVTTGLVGGSQTQITNGLQSGDHVAVRVAGGAAVSTSNFGGPGGPFQGRIIGPGGGSFKGITPGGVVQQQRVGNGP